MGAGAGFTIGVSGVGVTDYPYCFPVHYSDFDSAAGGTVQAGCVNPVFFKNSLDTIFGVLLKIDTWPADDISGCECSSSSC